MRGELNDQRLIPEAIGPYEASLTLAKAPYCLKIRL